MDMDALIKQTVEEYDREWAEKQELARHAEYGVRDIFTEEEYADLCRRNESIRGTREDFSQEERYKKLAMCARWLYEHAMGVTAYDVEPKAVRIDIRGQKFFNHQELQVFAAMTAMAGEIFISGIHEKEVRMFFSC